MTASAARLIEPMHTDKISLNPFNQGHLRANFIPAAKLYNR